MWITMVMLLVMLCAPVVAQESQVAVGFVLREQKDLGYRLNNAGVRAEVDYKINDALTAVASTMFLHSPKQDSGTGNSWFGGAGVRWAPLRYSNVDVFGSLALNTGYLSTDLYSKGVAHFRTGLGVRLMGRRLLLEAARLYQDMLPDASAALRGIGFDPTRLHETFNQLSAWEYDGQYWSKPFGENGKWGMKVRFTVSTSKFYDSFAQKHTGWLYQYELGPYRRL